MLDTLSKINALFSFNSTLNIFLLLYSLILGNSRLPHSTFKIIPPSLHYLNVTKFRGRTSFLLGIPHANILDAHSFSIRKVKASIYSGLPKMSRVVL